MISHPKWQSTTSSISSTSTSSDGDDGGSSSSSSRRRSATTSSPALILTMSCLLLIMNSSNNGVGVSWKNNNCDSRVLVTAFTIPSVLKTTHSRSLISKRSSTHETHTGTITSTSTTTTTRLQSTTNENDINHLEEYKQKKQPHVLIHGIDTTFRNQKSMSGQFYYQGQQPFLTDVTTLSTNGTATSISSSSTPTGKTTTTTTTDANDDSKNFNNWNIIEMKSNKVAQDLIMKYSKKWIIERENMKRENEKYILSSIDNNHYDDIVVVDEKAISVASSTPNNIKAKNDFDPMLQENEERTYLQSLMYLSNIMIDLDTKDKIESVRSDVYNVVDDNHDVDHNYIELVDNDSSYDDGQLDDIQLVDSGVNSDETTIVNNDIIMTPPDHTENMKYFDEANSIKELEEFSKELRHILEDAKLEGKGKSLLSTEQIQDIESELAKNEMVIDLLKQHRNLLKEEEYNHAVEIDVVDESDLNDNDVVDDDDNNHWRGKEESTIPEEKRFDMEKNDETTSIHDVEILPKVTESKGQNVIDILKSPTTIEESYYAPNSTAGKHILSEPTYRKVEQVQHNEKSVQRVKRSYSNDVSFKDFSDEQRGQIEVSFIPRNQRYAFKNARIDKEERRVENARIYDLELIISDLYRSLEQADDLMLTADQKRIIQEDIDNNCDILKRLKFERDGVIEEFEYQGASNNQDVYDQYQGYEENQQSDDNTALQTSKQHEFKNTSGYKGQINFIDEEYNTSSDKTAFTKGKTIDVENGGATRIRKESVSEDTLNCKLFKNKKEDSGITDKTKRQDVLLPNSSLSKEASVAQMDRVTEEGRMADLEALISDLYMALSKAANLGYTSDQVNIIKRDIAANEVQIEIQQQLLNEARNAEGRTTRNNGEKVEGGQIPHVDLIDGDTHIDEFNLHLVTDDNIVNETGASSYHSNFTFEKQYNYNSKTFIPRSQRPATKKARIDQEERKAEETQISHLELLNEDLHRSLQQSLTEDQKWIVQKDIDKNSATLKFLKNRSLIARLTEEQKQLETDLQNNSYSNYADNNRNVESKKGNDN